MTQPPLPDFIIIGAQKSATRWLRINLGEHPDIYTPPAEVHYWNNGNRVRNHGLTWYRDQFKDAGAARIVGEATPGYMIWRHHPDRVAARLHESLPDVRLIAVLRNPIDRAASAVAHHVRRGRLAPDTRLVDVVAAQPPEKDRLCLVTGGWYAACLAPFAEHFSDRLLVLLHDDIVATPEAVYETALRHVGADPSFRPRELAKIRFSNRSTRLTSSYDLSSEDRVALWEYFADDVARLSTLIGRDLSHWDPTRARVGP
jgi:hypothetical protein